MKTLKLHLAKILLGGALMALFFISYSCTQETVLDSEEPIEAVNASVKKDTDEKRRPWKIRSAGTFQAIGPSAECSNPELPVTILLEGSGNASHIGLYDVAITWCTNPIFDLAAPENFIVGTLTAANGDIIYFESTSFNGESVDYRVTDGTGRFAGASGVFNLATTQFAVNPETGAGTYANQGEGYIIY